jgi:DNA-binding MarR family transcriptional regulator
MTDQKAQDQAGASSIAHISDVMARLRLLVGRRVISRTAIDTVAPQLDISHLDVLDAMRRIDGEVTIGAIAEMMRLDPSRGSRLVAEMVAQGVLRRDISQIDGRRSVVVRTEAGDHLLDQIHTTKRRLLASMLTDWPEEELTRFAPLFDKFVSRFEAVYSADKPQPDATSKA